MKLRLYHPRYHILVFGGIGIGGSYAASFLTNFNAFKYLYCISLGIAGGATYMTAVSIAW